MAASGQPWLNYQQDIEDEKNPQNNPVDLRTVGYKALGALPTAGTIGGGMLGSGLGSIPAAGGGAALGRAAELAGKKYLYGEDLPKDVPKDLGESAVGGMVNEAGGQAIGKATGALSGASKYATKKVGSALTGIPEKAIETYQNHAEDIMNMAKESGGSMAEAADIMRNGFNKSIKNTRDALNSKIGSVLKSSDKTVPIQSTVDALNEVKSQLKPDLHGQDIAQIDKILEKIKNREILAPASKVEYPSYLKQEEYDPQVQQTLKMFTPPQSKPPFNGMEKDLLPASHQLSMDEDFSEAMNDTAKYTHGAEQGSFSNYEIKPITKQNIPTGHMSVQDAHDMKKYMQGIVSDSYRKPGEIFTTQSGADRGVKAGAANLRLEINQAEPGVAKANESLSELHDIEDRMNKNLIAEGKPHAALMAAGSGGNEKSVKDLKDLGNITGHDMQGDAEKLAALRYFGKPETLPVDTTGKASGRMTLGRNAGAAAGAGIGGLLSHNPYVAAGGAAAGGALGSAATSPVVLKAGIDAQKAIGGGAKRALQAPGVGTGIMSTPQIINAIESNPKKKQAPWEKYQ